MSDEKTYTTVEAGRLAGRVMEFWIISMYEAGYSDAQVDDIFRRVEGKCLADVVEAKTTGFNPIFGG